MDGGSRVQAGSRRKIHGVINGETRDVAVWPTSL